MSNDEQKQSDEQETGLPHEVATPQEQGADAPAEGSSDTPNAEDNSAE